MQLTIVQYGGDYYEAWERFAKGGKATYQAQRYSVEFVSSLAERLERVNVICAVTDRAYDVVLPNNVRAVGGGFKSGFREKDIVPLVSRSAPDRLVLVTPNIPLLWWSRHNRIPTLATLADSFQPAGLRNRIRNRVLAHALNGSTIEWVGNHGLGACLSLLKIGVRAEKVIPWDWPPSQTPSEYAPRELDSSRPLRLAYVGAISELKGVGDLLNAIGRIRDAGGRVSASIAGSPVGEDIRSMVDRLAIGEMVTFLGHVPNEDVPLVMRAADVVVIPSRHEYPEGLPLTIYEALATRTPIIASDHPMFSGALVHEQSALVFPAGNVDALSNAIQRLGSHSELYAKLSVNSEAAWTGLQLPVVWGELIERWLSDTPLDRHWLESHRVASGRYDEQISARARATDCMVATK